ncbi:MAG TPA: hypothetical protein ENH82_12050 [bacterium]|nr:hypothetical protein [bacterium]
MSEKLSPETHDNIEHLCKQISVAHNLDDEIREELRTHMEDKILCYLDGDEKLTGDDAFILVREHFGDPAVVKALYQDVEAVASQVSLFRRIGAIMAASISVGIFYSVLLIILKIIDNLLKAGSTFGERSTAVYVSRFFIFVFIGCLSIFSMIVLRRILLTWRKRIDTGCQPWFLTVKPLTFIFIIGVLLLINTLLPFINYNNVLQLARTPVFFSGAPDVYTRTYPVDYDPVTLSTSSGHNILLVLAGPFYLFFFSYLWLWWCDSPPRRYRSLLIGAVAWLVYFSCIHILQPSNILNWDYTTQQFISQIRWEFFMNDQYYIGRWIFNGVLGACALGMYIFLLLVKKGRLVLTAQEKKNLKVL